MGAEQQFVNAAGDGIRAVGTAADQILLLPVLDPGERYEHIEIVAYLRGTEATLEFWDGDDAPHGPMLVNRSLVAIGGTLLIERWPVNHPLFVVINASSDLQYSVYVARAMKVKVTA